MHGAKREWILDIDEYSGTRWHPGGVELPAPGVRDGTQCREVEAPLATRVGQETPVRPARGALSEKLMKKTHRRMLTWFPERQLGADWAYPVSCGASAIGPGPIDQCLVWTSW